LRPPNIVGTYNLIFTGVNCTCEPSFTILAEGHAIGKADSRIAQRFPGTALRRGGAACGPSSTITAVTSVDAQSEEFMTELGLPTASSRLYVSQLMLQAVAWSDVVGFNFGSLLCGDHPQRQSSTLALWADEPWRLTSIATGEPVERGAGQRYLVVMEPKLPLCVFSVEAWPGGDDGGGGGLQTSGIAAIAGGGAVAIAAAALVAYWGGRRRHREDDSDGGDGKAAAPGADGGAAAAVAPPPPPAAVDSLPVGRPHPLSLPQRVEATEQRSWDDDERRSSSVAVPGGGSGSAGRRSSSHDASSGSGPPERQSLWGTSSAGRSGPSHSTSSGAGDYSTGGGGGGGGGPPGACLPGGGAAARGARVDD